MIHLSVARKILNAGKPVDLLVWKANGEILRLNRAVSLRYDFETGCRNMKVTGSRAVRKVRDVCIFMINGEEVRL